MKNRNLNILQILPNLESGGVERGTLEIADYLARAGHNSYVISGGGRLVTNLQKGGSHHITLPIGKKS
ncbi:MAG: glycosyl transferase, partial [Methylophilaceae bacterium]|nr:glycosyl transferase [Methylophilaceae bacterium]